MKSVEVVLAGAVLVAIGIVAFAGMAAAHSATNSSQHTMGFEADVASDVFTGQVSSTKAACERGRSIKLYRVVGDTSVADEEVAAAATNPSGIWSRGLAQGRAGDYYAVAAKKVIRSSGHRHACKPATAPVVSVIPELDDLSLDPDMIAVNEESTGLVSLSVATEDDLTVTLENSHPSVATVPASVTVLAGQSQAAFPITGVQAGSTTIRATMGVAMRDQTLIVE